MKLLDELEDVCEEEELFRATPCSSPSGQMLAVSRAGPFKTLHNLSLVAFLNQLKNLCQKKNYAENKRGLKHFLKFLLPVQVRQQLLDLAMKEARIYTLVDLNIFELLLSPSVKKVQIQSIRPFFRQPFTAMLRQLGNGLEDLILEECSWLQGRDSLPSALARMTSLSRVSLRYLANDLMIAAIAKNCQQLQEMDVSHSSQVTDAGMKVLCRPEEALLLLADPADCHISKGKSKNRPSSSTVGERSRIRKISAPAIHSVTGCMLWFRGQIRRHSVVHHNKLVRQQVEENDEEDGQDVEVEETLSIHQHNRYQENPSKNAEPRQKCIRSLQRLDVHGTCVTPAGIQLVLASSPTISITT